MKLWLSKSSDVPMRDQLITQIKIGVASDDLQTGEKLPSRGEIARRFGVHENTVSNAYKELVKSGLIQFKQGSGFYVCEAKVELFETEPDINSITLDYLKAAKRHGYSTEEIRETFNIHLRKDSPNEILVIESDEKLREILVGEIIETTNAKTLGVSFEEFESDTGKFDSVLVALSDEEEHIQNVLPKDKHCIYLKAQSVPSAMQGETRPTEDSLIAIASGWDAFLLMAKTILVAAKVEGDSIILRSTKDEDWQRGLDNAALIICDSLTAKNLPNDKRVRRFPIISEDSILELTNVINV